MGASSADPSAAAGVCQAERGVGQRVQTLRLDRLAADLAAAVAAVVDAPEGALDLLDQVPQAASRPARRPVRTVSSSSSRRRKLLRSRAVIRLPAPGPVRDADLE